MGTGRTYLKRADEQAHGVPTEVSSSVSDILQRVREDGDAAIRELTRTYDDVDRDTLQVTAAERAAAEDHLSGAARRTIDNTIANVRSFHEEQRAHLAGFETERTHGITLGTRLVPIDRVGVYVPGGRKPLVAAPAMTIVPAVVAGVGQVIACAPPQADGTPDPAQVYAMDRAGADEIYVAGGAQAIGAMAYGTETVEPVDKVTGPGNVYVTEAKRQVFGHVSIDFLAGPTEVLVVADATADPQLVAADLLAQAEHDPHARAILVSTDLALAEATRDAIEAQLPALATAETARSSWEQNGEIVVVEERAHAAALANEYAPEHLQLMIDEPRELVTSLRNYGSLFLGHHAPVVFGDKAIGTNHTLPTGSAARHSGGISVMTYLKVLTHQELTASGADTIAPWAAKICELEGTHAHQRSAEHRIRSTEARGLARDLELTSAGIVELEDD